MNYSFSIEIATAVGVNGAIMLDNIAFWVKKNKANDRNYFKGKYWTYNSVKAYKEFFPFWSIKTTRTTLEKLEVVGYLIADCFNKDTRDRTKWYTLSDKSESLYESLATTQKGKLHLPKSANAFAQIGKCSNNTDFKLADKKPTSDSPFNNATPQLLEAWNGFRDMRKSMRKPLTERATALTLKKLDELSGGDEKKKIAILNQSVMNGWQSVYALHTDKRKNSNTDDIYNDALAMLEQEGVFDDDGQGGNDCNH